MFGTIRSRLAANDGFTLAELLVVLLIIGSLMAMAIPTYTAMHNKAQDVSTESDVRDMFTQVESCFIATGDYGRCQTTPGSALDTGGLPNSVIVAYYPPSVYVYEWSKTTNQFVIQKYLPTSGVGEWCVRNASYGNCLANGKWGGYK